MRPVRPSAPFMTDCDGRGRPVNGFAALRKNFMQLQHSGWLHRMGYKVEIDRGSALLPNGRRC
ncbi:hypothetical protein DSM109990_03267 [Sulfitobacter dubius]|uniref:Uncharacterized protein n=1 Tax=Sulfitobacter dubius TaxID=218673 RepID=A0ABY3ZP30_9RHOB|nr:hypothetical protein DSM109990_03267 [Sulfitobacter dubius]